MSEFANKDINKKTILLLLSIFFVVGFLFSGLIFLDYNSIKKIDISEMEKDAVGIGYNIEIINNEPNNYMSIKGWAYKQGVEIKLVKCYVALREVSSNTVYKLNTTMQIRTDVTSYFHDGYNYDKSGFQTLFPKNKLKSGVYEVCLLYQNDNNNIFVITDKKITI